MTKKILLILTLCFITSNISAEPSNGRLPDGRAFRTDSQGSVMVDYIAELELEADSLRRQVQSLEEEVTELRNSSVSNKDTYKIRTVEVKDTKPIECPKINCPTCVEKICPQVVCEKNICEKTECPNIVKTENCPVFDKQTECKDEFQQIADLSKQLNTNSQKQFELQQHINLTNIQLDSLKQRESKLIEENSKLIKEQNLVKASVNLAEIKKSEQPVAVLPNRNLNNKLEREPSKNREILLVQIKDSIKKDLSGLSKLVTTRDAKFIEFKKNYSGAVKIEPQKIIFNDESTITNIINSLDNQNSMRELSSISKQISESSNKLNFEIGMMNRLIASANKQVQ
jgi:hypothetical protein